MPPLSACPREFPVHHRMTDALDLVLDQHLGNHAVAGFPLPQGQQRRIIAYPQHLSAAPQRPGYQHALRGEIGIISAIPVGKTLQGLPLAGARGHSVPAPGNILPHIHGNTVGQYVVSQNFREHGPSIGQRLRLVVQQQRRHPPPLDGGQQPLLGQGYFIGVHHAPQHDPTVPIGGKTGRFGQNLRHPGVI